MSKTAAGICPACGLTLDQPVARADLSRACRACQERYWRAGRPAEDVPALHALVRAWDLPDDVPHQCVYLHGEDFAAQWRADHMPHGIWRGYRVECLTVPAVARLAELVARAAQEAHEVREARPGFELTVPDVPRAAAHPWRYDVWDRSQDNKRDQRAVLRVRIWHPERRGYVEGRIVAEERAVSRRLVVSEPRPSWSVMDVGDLTKGEYARWYVVLRGARAGRPPGSGYFRDRDEFLAACRNAMTRNAPHPRPNYLSRARLAPWMNVELTTLKRRMRGFGLSPDDIQSLWHDVLAGGTQQRT